MANSCLESFILRTSLLDHPAIITFWKARWKNRGKAFIAVYKAAGLLWYLPLRNVGFLAILLRVIVGLLLSLSLWGSQFCGSKLNQFKHCKFLSKLAFLNVSHLYFEFFRTKKLGLDGAKSRNWLKEICESFDQNNPPHGVVPLASMGREIVKPTHLNKFCSWCLLGGLSF